MYLPAILVMVFSLVLLPSSTCHQDAKPKRFFHWKTNSSEDIEITKSSSYWIEAASNQPSITCCSSSSTAPAPNTHTVTVGANGTLLFDPIEVDANVGDIVIFTFLALNHTLTQSSLQNPCANQGGFSTGFNQFNPKDAFGKSLVEYRVDTLDPQWFFCAQTDRVSHCRAGMVFALNAGTKLDSFLSIATESPSHVGQSTISAADDQMSAESTSSITALASLTLTVEVGKQTAVSSFYNSVASISASASIFPSSSARLAQTPVSPAVTIRPKRVLTQLFLLMVLLGVL